MPSSQFIAALVAGFALGGGLIVAIGAQNAFVLRQGIRRERVGAVVATCIACDWVLIVAGALGFGTLVSAFPVVTAVAAWGGAAFLAWHGAMSVRSAMHPESLEPQESGAARLGLGAAISATLAISLLNPHVYLDTVVLIGSVAAQYEPLARAWFTAGACLASLVWFASIGYGARLLAPLFDRPVAWRVLDIVIAVVMFSIAASLVWGQIG